MRHLFFVLCFFIALGSNAQNHDTATKLLNVFSSLGLSFADNNFKPASGNSIQTSTGLELQFSRRSSLGAMLSFDSYGYKKSGTGYNLDGSLKATGLALFYHYKFGSHTWQPYLKAGGGTTWLTVPVVSMEQSTTFIRKKNRECGIAACGSRSSGAGSLAVLFATWR